VRGPEPLSEKIQRALKIGRAVGLVWRCAPGFTAAHFALTTLQGLLPLAALYLMKLVVDAVTAGISSPDKSAAFHKAAVYIALAGAVAVALVLLRAAATLVSEVQGQALTDYVSDILHAKSVEVDLEYYENPRYYDTLHRAQQEAHYRPMRIVSGLAVMAQSGLSLLAMSGLLLALHWAVALVLFAASLPGLLVRLKFSGRLYRWEREHTEAERRSWYYHWMMTDGRHAKEVRLFDLGGLFRDWYKEVRAGLRAGRLKLTAGRSGADLAAQGAASVLVFSTYAFIACRAIQGAITLGDLVMYFAAFQRGLSSLQDLLGGIAGLYEDNLFLTNFYEFMDLKPRVVESEDPKPVPKPFQKGFVFENVSFTYPSSQTPVLSGASLAIRPGEVVALVGENGAGKTTLIKLLCRLYDPTEGRITLDGMDLRAHSTLDLRRQVGVIFQDFACYSLTARENIWLGNRTIPKEDGRVVEAARQSGADPLIERLPKGYETVLGLWFEDAKELSWGEWQKIALARAFLRDAQLVVLDEPTSSMDAMAEYEVFVKFRKLLEGRSAVLISHRFSTVKMADTIYVFEGGRVSESGSHESLMAKRGTYARLFETQAQYYR